MIDRRAFLGLAGASAASGLILFGRSGAARATVSFPINHSPAEWRRILGPERYAVLREACDRAVVHQPAAE